MYGALTIAMLVCMAVNVYHEVYWLAAFAAVLAVIGCVITLMENPKEDE